MAIVENTTPFVMQTYEKWDHQGDVYQVITLKGTFDMVAHQPMSVSPIQIPLVTGDEHFPGLNGVLFYSQLVREGDLILGKRTTDICVSGTSFCPEGYKGIAQSQWRASVQVGQYKKTLNITGPRYFIKGADGWTLSDPEPATSVVLDYRQAFGGHVPVARQFRQEDRDVAYLFNPIGQGWLPDDEDLKNCISAQKEAIAHWRDNLSMVTAPQITDIDKPVSTPFDRPIPAGIGPIARWWQPRYELQGTLDQTWQDQRSPYPPEDFNERFYQCAHPDLITQTYLSGDETVTLENIGIANYRGSLPGIVCEAIDTRGFDKPYVLPFVLDTVRIDAMTRQAVLVWRLQLLAQGPIRRLTVIHRPAMASAAGDAS